MKNCVEQIDFSGKSCSVCGIGISNYPLINFLLDHGATVVARDIKPREKLTCADELEKKGVRVICGENYLKGIEEDYIFRAPGIRYDIPEFCDAVKNGSELTSEMELFFELSPCRIIGITGSDGKTTTTTLISEILKKSGYNVFLGGNIGTPLLPRIGEMTSDDIAVVELSSFQLHTMKCSPDIAVVTNISPNHLNYHTDMNEYVDAKRNIYRYMNGGRLVLNGRDNITRSMAKDAPENTETVYFCDKSGIYADTDGFIKVSDNKTGNTENILKISDILLPGNHNVENYMAAIGAVYGIADNDAVRKVAVGFAGVEHRCEFVGECKNIRFYNSSIDSSPTRTAAALGNFKAGHIVIICGGYDKHVPFGTLAAALADRAKTVVLTGATAEAIGKAIADEKTNRDMNGNDERFTDVIYEPDFEKSVFKAYCAAVPGDVVLLSPACASFDAFPNFEVRGNRFKSIVSEIIEKENIVN